MMEIFTVVVDDHIDCRVEYATPLESKAQAFVVEALVEKLERSGREYSNDAVVAAAKKVLAAELGVNTFIEELPGISVVRLESARGDCVLLFYDNGFFFLKETLQKVFLEE